MAPGRPFTSDTTICRHEGQCPASWLCPHPGQHPDPTSPFSRGTIREYSVLHTTSSSCSILSSVRGPKRSKQSLLEAANRAGTLCP